MSKLPEKLKNPLQVLVNKAIKEGIDKGPAIRGILTDVMHLCDTHGLHFQKVLEGASEVYKEEKGLYFSVSDMAGDTYKTPKVKSTRKKV